jgi:hypothetical protein
MSCTAPRASTTSLTRGTMTGPQVVILLSTVAASTVGAVTTRSGVVPDWTDLEDIQAGQDADYLYGEGENDVLSSTDGDGSDRLDGGSGSDNCQGDTNPPDTKVNCP